MTGGFNVPVISLHDAATNEAIPSDGSASFHLPPIPDEVKGWSDSAQELFCILSVGNQSAGRSVEEADRLALEGVRKSEGFTAMVV